MSKKKILKIELVLIVIIYIYRPIYLPWLGMRGAMPPFPPYAIIACAGTILRLVRSIGHGCSKKRFWDFLPCRRVSVPEGGQDSTMERSAVQARFGPSLKLILSGGGPSSPGWEVGERVTPYVIMTQTVTDGPTYCLV